MKIRKLRIALPLAVLAVAGIGFAASADFGTLSAPGWSDISVLCPLGALTTMLAERAAVPRAIVSLLVFVVVVIVAGKAFCSWVCPVPVVERLRGLFSPRKRNREDAGKPASDGADASPANGLAPLTDEEKALLAGCSEKRSAIDTRHFVLGGSLLSAAVFGFPVFCLVCPIGLSFATVLLLVRAFGFGDATWGLLVAPALLALEVVVFRKWCHAICPLGALMSLVARANRTLRPRVDEAACIESSGGKCSRCAAACPEGIDPHDPARGADMAECTRCMACVDACPTGAMSLALATRRGAEVEVENARE